MKAQKSAPESPKSGSILSESRSRVVVHSFSSPEQNREFDRLLEKHHYLGACPPVGDFLRQWVFLDGELVALLAWGACCYHLKARDGYIGWDPRRATERLKWVVQNRRYALLTAKGEAPNLASQVLGAVVRALPKQWEERFGYAPLAAESFSEIEAGLPPAMALDGKMVRDIGGVVSIVDASDGIPISMAPMRHKEEGPDGEATCARKALADVGDLQGSSISTDAGNTSNETATQILDQGGEILLQIKGNQPTLLEQAQRRTSSAPFFLSA